MIFETSPINLGGISLTKMALEQIFLLGTLYSILQIKVALEQLIFTRDVSPGLVSKIVSSR